MIMAGAYQVGEEGKKKRSEGLWSTVGCGLVVPAMAPHIKRDVGRPQTSGLDRINYKKDKWPRHTRGIERVKKQLEGKGWKELISTHGALQHECGNEL